MYKFEIETRTGAVHQYAIIDSYQEITLDKHRQYFKTILPIQPKIKADDDWDADFSDVCEWAVQVCALFSNCSEDMLWELPPFYLLGGKLESGEYFEGLVYKVIQAFDALHDYEQELALNVNNKKSAFNIIKGSFVHKGVEYFLPAKGFDETKMEEFVRLQQLQAFSDKLSNQNEKNKINAKAKKQGKDIQSDEWDIAAAMLAVLAKPKVGGQWVKGYNKKDIAAREEAFKDVPMYLLKDVGFFLQKIAHTTHKNSLLYSKAMEVAKMKEELLARQANTSGIKPFKTLQNSQSSPAPAPNTAIKSRSLWTRIRSWFYKH